jgi:hypothetical protein
MRSSPSAVAPDPREAKSSRAAKRGRNPVRSQSTPRAQTERVDSALLGKRGPKDPKRRTGPDENVSRPFRSDDRHIERAGIE